MDRRTRAARRGRSLFESEVVSIAPSGFATVEVRPPVQFLCEGLFVEPVVGLLRWRVASVLSAISFNLRMVIPNIWAKRQLGFAVWRPLRERPPDFRQVLEVKVGDRSQMEGVSPVDGVPAIAFYEASRLMVVDMRFDPAGPGVPIVVKVRNDSKEEAKFSFYVVGVEVDERGVSAAVLRSIE